jgi:glycerol-3-phosphate dehydrogenase
MDNSSHKPIVQPSGIYIELPNSKLLLSAYLIFLRWEGNTIVDTTDSPAPVENEPSAAEDEDRWVLEEV